MRVHSFHMNERTVQRTALRVSKLIKNKFSYYC
jgi:ribosomal protein S17E